MDPDGLFGHVNDSIRGLATEAQESETWEFFCECPDLACHALVSLTVLEFDERRRALPPMPIVVAGHNGGAPERDVQRGDTEGTRSLR